MVQYIIAYKDENGTVHSLYYRNLREYSQKRRELDAKGIEYQKEKRTIEYPCAVVKTFAL